MTTRNRNQNRTPSREAQAPSLIAYHVTEGRNEGDKGFWTRIGAAWDHEDAKGMTLQLDLMPMNGGRIVLREPKADEPETGNEKVAK